MLETMNKFNVISGKCCSCQIRSKLDDIICKFEKEERRTYVLPSLGDNKFFYHFHQKEELPEDIKECFDALYTRETVSELHYFEEKISIGSDCIKGLKYFIETLLTKDSTIVIEDIGSCLHPAQKIVVAEILVLLVKHYNSTIICSTFCPYTLRAIQVYSAKHGLADKVAYFNMDGDTMENVTNNTEIIFQHLAYPFQTLMNAE